MKDFNYDEFKRKVKLFMNNVVCFGNETREFSKTELAHKMFLRIIVSGWIFGIILSIIAIPSDNNNPSKSFSDVQIENVSTSSEKSEESNTDTSSSEVIPDSESVAESNSSSSDNTIQSA